jgi:hypothetical protein
MLLGTCAMESNGSVRKLKRNASRCSGASRRASSIFLGASISPSLLGRREALKPGNEDVAVDFVFIAPSYMETISPSSLRTMTL